MQEDKNEIERKVSYHNDTVDLERTNRSFRSEKYSNILNIQ